MLNLQDYSNTPVPDNEGPRLGWLYMTNVEIALTVCVPIFMFGAVLGQSLKALDLMLVLLISGLILAIASSWSSYIGERTRLSTALLVERSFGRHGSLIVWFILATCMFGWFGVQTELLVNGGMGLAARLYPDVVLNKGIVTILLGTLMSSTSVMGIRAIGKLAQLAVPLLLTVILYALYTAIKLHGLSVWIDHVPVNPMGLGEGVGATMGAYTLAALCMPDIKRFSVNCRHAVLSAVYSLGLFYPLFLLLTAVTSVLANEPDFMQILLGAGLGSGVLFILLLATWTTNDVNLYCASLSLSRLFPFVARQWLALISGICGTSLALLGIFAHAIPLFILLGVLMTPLLVIYSVEFLLGHLAGLVMNRKVNIPAFITWILASAIGVLTTPIEQWGGGIFSITTIPAIDSLLISALVYPLFVLRQLLGIRNNHHFLRVERKKTLNPDSPLPL